MRRSRSTRAHHSISLASCGSISTTVTERPCAARYSAVSQPMSPPPSTRTFLPASAPLRMSCAVTAPAAEAQKRGTTGRLPVATITASGDRLRTLSGVASHEKRNVTPARWALPYR